MRSHERLYGRKVPNKGTKSKELAKESKMRPGCHTEYEIAEMERGGDDHSSKPRRHVIRSGNKRENTHPKPPIFAQISQIKKFTTTENDRGALTKL